MTCESPQKSTKRQDCAAVPPMDAYTPGQDIDPSVVHQPLGTLDLPVVHSLKGDGGHKYTAKPALVSDDTDSHVTSGQAALLAAAPLNE